MSILIVGQYVPSTGLTTVIQNLARCLNRDDSVSILGLAYAGPAVRDGGPVYPNAFDRERDVWTGLQDAAQVTKPDVILLVSELSTQAGLLTEVARQHLPAKVVCYTLVEGTVVDQEMMATLNAADGCVFFSEFAREQAARCIDAEKLRVIPHGVDTDTFRPMGGPIGGVADGDRQREARRALFPEAPELLDSFIILNANRPWVRKRIDLTVEGFALFSRDKPASVKLYLHHARTSDFERRSTRRLLEQFEVEDRVILGGRPPRSRRSPGTISTSFTTPVTSVLTRRWRRAGAW